MSNNWPETLNNLGKGGAKLAKEIPDVITAFGNLNAAAVDQGKVLDAKTRELISMAVAVTTRCDGCISAHAAAAHKAGASKEELAEARGVAIALNAGAAFVYSTRALEAFDQPGS